MDIALMGKAYRYFALCHQNLSILAASPVAGSGHPKVQQPQAATRPLVAGQFRHRSPENGTAG
jgi:hypothetical protein